MNIEHVKYITKCITDDCTNLEDYVEFYACADTRPTNEQDRTIAGFCGIHYATFYGSRSVFAALIGYEYELRTGDAASVQVGDLASLGGDREQLMGQTGGEAGSYPPLGSPGHQGTYPASPLDSPLGLKRNNSFTAEGSTLLLPAGQTPLSLSIITRNVGFFERITALHSNKPIALASPESPLHMAARVERTSFAFVEQLILQFINVQNPRHETPLVLAVRHGRNDILNKLEYLLSTDKKGALSAAIYTAFLYIYDAQSLSELAYRYGCPLIAVMCDKMVAAAEEFSLKYENFGLENAMLRFDETVQRKRVQRKLKENYSRLQGSGDVDWI